LVPTRPIGRISSRDRRPDRGPAGGSMAVLITGGLGFTGRRLTEHLREHGYDVKVPDIAIRTEPDYRRADVTRYEELVEVFRTWPIEHVSTLRRERGRERRR